MDLGCYSGPRHHRYCHAPAVWTVTKADISSSVSATLSAPRHVQAGGALTYTVLLNNNSQYSLNGTQLKITLPSNVSFTGATGGTSTVQGNNVVVTVGRLAVGAEQTVSINTSVSSERHGAVSAFAELVSSTALPLFTNAVVSTVRH